MAYLSASLEGEELEVWTADLNGAYCVGEELLVLAPQLSIAVAMACVTGKVDMSCITDTWDGG